MSKALGIEVFKDIESNDYLQEIFEAILLNYSRTLFNIKNQEFENFDVNHALQFADLLSKSVSQEKADMHKVWAQQIVALLYKLYSEDKRVQLYLSSVLKSVCNYRGLSLLPGVYQTTEVLDAIYSSYEKSILKIPSDLNAFFFKEQKMVYDALSFQHLSYSAPTSMGKSFIMRMFIKEQIIEGQKQNYAIVVPTKALINEVSSRIIADLQDLLAENDYRVITSSNALALQQSHNFVFVLTPERIFYLLLDKPDIAIHYLFIDEAHKISSKDSRSPFYYKVVNMLQNRSDKPHIIFSSPNIPNPEVYLGLISDLNPSSEMSITTAFSPVSQIKYVVDLINRHVQVYNDYASRFLEIGTFKKQVSLMDFIRIVGRKHQNIVYCSSTRRAVDMARDYADSISQKKEDRELRTLSNEIRNQIHNDYYLAEVLTKGIAYHIGYLPADIRLRIEELFRRGKITTIFCTSTLIEGVNLPADNLFITSYQNGSSNMNPVEFKNLIGRVGRIEFNLYGNVFLVSNSEKVLTQKYKEIVAQEVPKQRLSIVNELTKGQRHQIIESLGKGEMEFPKHPKNQTSDAYNLMRKFSIILLQDIMADKGNSVVINAFAAELSPEVRQKIIAAFKNRYSAASDINISVDQAENLWTALSKGLSYPVFNANENTVDYDTLVAFLEKLCEVFKWEIYESKTLGYRSKSTGNHSKLRWYAVILSQWIQGKGLGIIMQAAITYRQKNPNSCVRIGSEYVDYDDSIMHRNIIISDTLSAIEEVILFRLSNYFLRFSSEYKQFHNLPVLQNDWYEYVEYGTTNAITIMLQRNGFSREAATYIRKNSEYLREVDGEYRLLDTLLECDNKTVCKEASEVRYNIPELFIQS